MDVERVEEALERLVIGDGDKLTANNREQELDYVVEIYNFQPSLKTKDILKELSGFYRTTQFRIKWVDDTHAICMFSDCQEAHQALLIPFKHLKVRALECATEQSKLMARKVAEDMKPGSRTPNSNRWKQGGGTPGKRKQECATQQTCTPAATQAQDERPKTTAAVARRLVGHALGVRVPVSKYQQEKECSQLKEAKKDHTTEDRLTVTNS